MTSSRIVIMFLAAAFGAGHAQAAPTVYPTGTTIYDPDRAFSGYVVFHTAGDQGAVLIDMNGRELRRWPDLQSNQGPIRILPGGQLLSGTSARRPHQEVIALVQRTWDSREVWRFDRNERVQTADGETIWAARAHHDWQREGSAVGYFAPGSVPLTDRGYTLILTHKNVTAEAVSDKRLEDDYIIEVDWNGEILWEWLASDHVDEFGFSAEARRAIREHSPWNEARQSADWLHVNAAAYVGENRWYDAGDERFHPRNVIISSRNANIVAIIDRDGAIVWRIGPDFRDSPALAALGQISGQHHPHLIPKGLPGAGNMLIFDNGGRAGYGASTVNSPDGTGNVTRFHSRVVEFDPTTLEKVWEYAKPGGTSYQFFSYNVSMAQRLPNGNTAITEGATGRAFEVTPDLEIVWEYVSPYFNPGGDGRNNFYRAYRIPYDWIPQLVRPTETPVIPPPLEDFRVAPQ